MEKKPTPAERLRNYRKRKQEEQEKYEEFWRFVGEQDLELVLEFEAKRAKKQEVDEAALQSEASECIKNFCMSFLE